MNESAKLKTTFQASHRLDARNKVKRIDYESSELRAYEILDGICNELEKEFTFRLGSNGLRRFSNNKSLARADFYGKNDRKELRSITKRLKEVCLEITEESDHIIISLIKKVRDLNSLQTGLCFAEGFKCCGTKKVEASKEKERERRTKWLALKEEREEKRRQKEEREKQKKEAERQRKEAEAQGDRKKEEAEKDVSNQDPSENGDIKADL